MSFVLNSSNLVPLVILMWLGFFVCVSLLFSASLIRGAFQKRLRQSIVPVRDEATVIVQEQRDEEMGKSLLQRVLQPIVHRLGATLKARARGKGGQQIRDMLEQAGHPLGMGYAEFLGLKVLTLVVLSSIGFFSSMVVMPVLFNVLEMPPDPSSVLLLQAVWIAIFAFLGFAGPTFWLRRFVNRRIRQIRRAMADVVDLIVLSIEAGLGFDAAVGKTVEKTRGPLTDELRRVLAEVNVGKSQSEAFRDMALRVRMPELSLLVAAIDQAMKMGVGLGYTLRLQATEIRERRMAYIREQAGKLPVKMMLPLVLFIFPALFFVILGPAACQMAVMSQQGMLPF